MRPTDKLTNAEFISILWLTERREIMPFNITGRRLYCRR